MASSGILGLTTSCRDLINENDALLISSVIPEKLFFDISLAQWSFHKSLWSGELKNLDFARIAREKFGINAVEYVNQFFLDKARDQSYLAEMKKIAADNGVKSLMIMIDMEGSLGTLNEPERLTAVENHLKWIEAAHFLGCHSIRVNAAGKGDREAVANAVIDSLGRLCDYGSKEKINIIVENHGGYSSDADWLVQVIKQVNQPNVGVLPDLGNFMISLFPPTYYDPYEGVKKLMPYAKGVSAKSRDFSNSGEEKSIDFRKMLTIMKNAGFNGYMGIEYEGYKLSEEAGINATKNLLIKSGLQIMGQKI